MFEVDIHGVIESVRGYSDDRGDFVVAVRPGRTVRKCDEPMRFAVAHERRGFGSTAARADYRPGTHVVISGQLFLTDERVDLDDGFTEWGVVADTFIASGTDRHQYARGRVEGTLRHDPEHGSGRDGSRIANFVVRAFTEIHPDKAITIHCSRRGNDASQIVQSFAAGARIGLVVDIGEHRFSARGLEYVQIDGHVDRWYFGQDKATTTRGRRRDPEVIRR